MKSVTYLLTPTTGHYGRVGEFFRDHGIWVVGAHNVDGLTDGSVVIQFEVADTADRLHEILAAEREWIYDYQVASTGDRLMLQLHFQPGGVHREILELHLSHPVVLDYPLEIVDHASQTVRVTEVGKERTLRELLRETQETIDVTIERIGEYEHVANTIFDDLTERQQDVLGTAVRQGYYEEPRNVTYEEIAGDLDCSASAVGQHLRRAEHTVMSAVVPEDELAGRPDADLP